MSLITPYIEIDDYRTKRDKYPLIESHITKKLEEHLSNVEGKSILDIGSRYGLVGEWVLNLGASNYVGVEIDKECCKKCKNIFQ